MSDFETPLFRDISKIIPSVFIGILVALCTIFFFIMRFNLTVYGENCSESTSYTIIGWVLRSMTIQC